MIMKRCDKAVRLSLKHQQQEVEICTVPSPRPGLGARGRGCRQLRYSCSEPFCVAEDWRNKEGDVVNNNNKSVRFDETANQTHTIFKSHREGGPQFWYNSHDYEIFTKSMQGRVKHFCESRHKKPHVLALERAHLACMAHTCESHDDENHDAVLGLDKTLLNQTYLDNENLVGLETYIVEYVPSLRDRFEQHEILFGTVLKEDANMFLPIDRRCQSLSLGARVFAFQTAQATAASLAANE